MCREDFDKNEKSTETPPGTCMCRADFGKDENLRKLQVCVEKISAETKSTISAPGMC